MKPATESCLSLILLQSVPDHANSWAHFKAQHHHHGSLCLFFGLHLQKFPPRHDLFCSSWGYYAQCLGIGPFPVCEVIHFLTVMHYELWESRLAGVCVLWLGSLTPASPVNRLDRSFRLVWDSLPTQCSPRGGPQHAAQFNCMLLELNPSCYVWLSSAVFSMFLPAAHHELWLLNHS